MWYFVNFGIDIGCMYVQGDEESIRANVEQQGYTIISMRKLWSK